MKRHGSDGWIVRNMSGTGGLCTTPTSELSREATRQLIDEVNAMAVERGYKAEQFLICYQEFYTCYDDNGLFVKSEHYVEAVEVYPAEL